MKLITVALALLILVSTAAAVDFVPAGNINGKNTYSIFNFTYINGTRLYQNGSAVLDTSSVISANTIAWANVSGKPTNLSNFTDDLGNRGYTSLSNFSNDLGFVNGSYLNLTDQRYNETALCSAINASKLNITGLINRSQVVNNYATCSAGYAITDENETSRTCTAFGSSSLTLSQVSSNLGNWSGNQSSYSTTAAANLLYAPILATYNNITGLNSTKAQIGSSAACTYGVANLTLNAQGVPTVTCSAQQGANNLIDVTSANTYIAVSGTTNKTLTFNASTMVTTYYNATAVAVVTGTPQGSVTGLQVYDNIPYNVSEALSDVDFNVTFTGVTNFNQIIIRYKSVAGENHDMNVYLWDYTSNSWEGYQLLGHTNGVYNIISIGVFDPNDHASAINTPRIRFETTNTGGSTDKWNFDLVQIAQGQGTPSSVETDPFSIHKDGTTPLTANWNAGAFNITAQDVLVDEIKVSGGFGSTGVTLNNGDYWGDGNIYILGNLTAVNVAQITTNGSIIPVPTNTYNLGNSSNVWLDAYATTFYEGGNALNKKYLTQAGAVTALGNWSADKASYSTTSAANLLYAPILATWNNITGLQSANSTQLTLNGQFFNNITGLQSANSTQLTWNGNMFTNVTALQTFRTAITDNVSGIGNWSAAAQGTWTNITGKPAVGSCAAGKVVQNTTTGGVECVNATMGFTGADGTYGATTNTVPAIVVLNGRITGISSVTHTGDIAAITTAYTSGLTGGCTTATCTLLLNMTTVANIVGNWSGNQSSYSTTAAANLLYAPISTTWTNITNLQTQTTTLNTTIISINNSKMNLSGGTFTGQIIGTNVTMNNYTVTGVSTTLVCIFSDNYGCIIKANSTCRVFYSPDETTAMKVPNNGTTC
jgi:hypothetical protein